MEQLQSEQPLSSPTRAQLVRWRTFIETAWAVIDILDAELQAEQGISLGWYDALVHLEDAPEGLGMTDLANRILSSKSGLTRIVDRMEAAGLVRRERPPEDRRVVRVLLTGPGREALAAARAVHRRGVLEHFVAHVDDDELAALAATLEKVREHVRPLRPGRISRRAT